VSRLITASLIGAVKWLDECPKSWKVKAENDLRNQLARVWVPPEPGSSLDLGIKFEAKVCDYAAREAASIASSEHFKWFVEQCRGGVFQKKARKTIMIDDEEYCLYGKIDVWFPDLMLDIKTTRNYKGEAYYLDSIQHIMYCYMESISKFRYIVAEFVEGSNLVQAHHAIEFEAKSILALRLRIDSAIRKVLEVLKSKPGFMDLYETKFSQYYKGGKA